MILLLDIMDTVVYDPYRKELPEFFGLTLEELYAKKHPTAWKEFERNELSPEDFVEKFFDPPLNFDYKALEAHMKRSYRFMEGMEELLSDLRAQGMEMHALSNYPVWYQWIEESLALSRFLSWTFVSCKTGVRKPDPKAYLGAADTLGRDPADCIFVDDRKKNCDGAVRTGMNAIVFDSAADLRKKLQEFELL